MNEWYFLKTCYFSIFLKCCCCCCSKFASIAWKKLLFTNPCFFFQSLLDHHHPQLTSSPGMYLTQLTSNRDYADIHVQLMEDSIVRRVFMADGGVRNYFGRCQMVPIKKHPLGSSWHLLEVAGIGKVYFQPGFLLLPDQMPIQSNQKLHTSDC